MWWGRSRQVDRLETYLGLLTFGDWLKMGVGRKYEEWGGSCLGFWLGGGCCLKEEPKNWPIDSDAPFVVLIHTKTWNWKLTHLGAVEVEVDLRKSTVVSLWNQEKDLTIIQLLQRLFGIITKLLLNGPLQNPNRAPVAWLSPVFSKTVKVNCEWCKCGKQVLKCC
jgi:hypothetical protein